LTGRLILAEKQTSLYRGAPGARVALSAVPDNVFNGVILSGGVYL
jgi:phosphotransferase system IIA component